MHVVPLIIEPDPDDADCALPWVDVTIAGRVQRWVLDTGAARSQLPNDLLAASWPVVGDLSSSGVFGVASRRLVRVPDLVLGPLRVAALNVTVAGPGGEGLLGMDVLGALDQVIIDYRTRQLHLRLTINRALTLVAGSHPDLAMPAQGEVRRSCLVNGVREDRVGPTVTLQPVSYTHLTLPTSDLV